MVLSATVTIGTFVATGVVFSVVVEHDRGQFGPRYSGGLFTVSQGFSGFGFLDAARVTVLKSSEFGWDVVLAKFDVWKFFDCLLLADNLG